MRFGRKRTDGEEADAAGSEAAGPGDGVPADDRPAPARTTGPFDEADADLEAETPDGEPRYIDLGSLLLPPSGADLPLELRLQVDEQSETVLAVMLVNDDGALELRAFAAQRGGDLWGEARPSIAEQTVTEGGTAEEREGPFGVELACVMPVQDQPEANLVQPSRVIGVNGPRWMLRATLLGRPAIEPDTAGPWEDAIRSVVVRRGQAPMAPGQALPLHLPPQARKIG